MDKDETIIMLLVALTALANEAVAYVRDGGDGRYLMAAADQARLACEKTGHSLHGGVLN